MKLPPHAARRTKQFRPNRLLVSLVIAAFAGCSEKEDTVETVRSALTGYHFGVATESSYQDNWNVTLDYSTENGSEFGSRLAENNTWDWQFTTLQWGKPYFEETGDAWWSGIDTVHALYTNTHGNVNSSTAYMAMWEKDTFAYTTAMRLGDDSVGLGLLAAYACHLLKFDDGLLPTRWGNALRGGLYYLMGSQDIVYDGWTLSDTGEQVAENLNDGDLLYHAWFDGVGDCCYDQDGAVVSTGRSLGECEARRDNTQWPNIMAYVRLRDSDVQWQCWRYLNDI